MMVSAEGSCRSNQSWGRIMFNVFSFATAIIVQLQLYSSVAECNSYEIRPQHWNYKSRYEIGYEVTKAITDSDDSNVDSVANNPGEPIVLLNGFGVGSFHQHRLIHQLFDDERKSFPQRTVYCMDYLGQGRSWPKDCQDGRGENEKDLQYSANT